MIKNHFSTPVTNCSQEYPDLYFCFSLKEGGRIATRGRADYHCSLFATFQREGELVLNSAMEFEE
jgi:hypothetical protein